MCDESAKLRAGPLAALEVRVLFDPCCMHWEHSRGCFLFDVVMHQDAQRDTTKIIDLDIKTNAHFDLEMSYNFVPGKSHMVTWFKL